MNHTIHSHIYKDNISLDVYLPAPAKVPMPVVMYIHWGALIFGSRKDVMENEIDAILGAGMAYVSIDYRLAPETKLMDIKTDIEAALQWIRETDLYDFDPGRIAVIGKSAGGYLALLSGTFADRPQAIVSFYGYGDILGDWYTKPCNHYLQDPQVSQSEADECVLQTAPTYGAFPDRWPIYLRARQTGTWPSLVSGYEPGMTHDLLTPYCPILNIDAHFPPTFLLHGTADTDVPFGLSQDMYNALAEKGINVQLCVVPDGPHIFDSTWQNGPDEFGQVVDFIKNTLAV